MHRRIFSGYHCDIRQQAGKNLVGVSLVNLENRIIHVIIYSVYYVDLHRISPSFPFISLHLLCKSSHKLSSALVMSPSPVPLWLITEITEMVHVRYTRFYQFKHFLWFIPLVISFFSCLMLTLISTVCGFHVLHLKLTPAWFLSCFFLMCNWSRIYFYMLPCRITCVCILVTSIIILLNELKYLCFLVELVPLGSFDVCKRVIALYAVVRDYVTINW